METEHHPVWTVYDKLRTARLNVKYYGCQLRLLQRVNIAMEITLAVTAPTSVVAGYSLWKYGVGAAAWSVLSGIAGIIAVCKPILGLTKRIRDVESLVAGYRLLDFELMEIKNSIEQEQSYTSALKGQFKKVTKSERELISRTLDATANKRLLRTCREEVERELPVDHFYIPPEEEQ